MRNILPNKSSGQEIGAALIELVIVLPFVLLMICGGIEFTLLLTRKNSFNAVLRETTLLLDKRCVDKPDISGLTTCTGGVYNEMRGLLLRISPDARFRIQSFHQVALPLIPASANVPPSASFGDFGFGTAVLNNATFPITITTTKTIFIVEVEVRSRLLFHGIIPGLPEEKLHTGVTYL